MNFENLKNKMIFRRDNDYGSFYSIGLSKKNEDGSYENGYLDVRFKKSIELENKTKININESQLSFYKKNNGEYDTTVPYIFINDFEIVDSDSEETPDTDFDDSDLPF